MHITAIMHKSPLNDNPYTRLWCSELVDDIVGVISSCDYIKVLHLIKVQNTPDNITSPNVQPVIAYKDTGPRQFGQTLN